MTQHAVLGAARTVLGRDPGASLDEVARVAGVSRTTVYRRFGSREALLRELDLEPGPAARERALAAALELVGRDGLARLSMDEVAEASGLSRASLYRLFPGKPALFRELLRTYSPAEAIVATIERLRDRPPEEVMPELARTAVRALAGRTGVVRTLVFEVTAASAESAEAARFMLVDSLSVFMGYVTEQMAAGRLRTMNPVLALQSFAGPLLIHLIARPAVKDVLGVELPLEETATELAQMWVRAMSTGGQDE